MGKGLVNNDQGGRDGGDNVWGGVSAGGCGGRKALSGEEPISSLSTALLWMKLRPLGGWHSR